MNDYYKTQWWLAELDQYGSGWMTDGPHDDRDSAEQALTIIKSLSFLNSDKDYAIAEVRLSKPTGVHDSVNQDAIDTLNKMKNLED